MKLITAIINKNKLEEVREALIEKQITRITVGRVSGRGRQNEEDLYRGQEVALDLIPKIRIDIACNDEFVKPICDTIIAVAKNNGGQVGDGKIFITALEDCIRIRTGESGSEAI